MTTRLFSTMESRIAPSVPGCPLPTIIQYVRRSAREACEKTLAWRYKQDDVTLVSGTYEYAYTPPSDTEVCGVIHTAINGLHAPFITQEDLHDWYPAWPSTAAADLSQPLAISQFDPDNFVVAPVPDGDTTYTVKMFLALEPTTTATGMDQTIMDELEDVIFHGTLQHMLVMPDKSWTDRELATYHAKQYRYKTASRRAKVRLGTGRAALSARMQPFGA